MVVFYDTVHVNSEGVVFFSTTSTPTTRRSSGAAAGLSVPVEGRHRGNPVGAISPSEDLEAVRHGLKASKRLEPDADAATQPHDVPLAREPEILRVGIHPERLEQSDVRATAGTEGEAGVRDRLVERTRRRFQPQLLVGVVEAADPRTHTDGTARSAPSARSGRRGSRSVSGHR